MRNLSKKDRSKSSLEDDDAEYTYMYHAALASLRCDILLCSRDARTWPRKLWDSEHAPSQALESNAI